VSLSCFLVCGQSQKRSKERNKVRAKDEVARLIRKLEDGSLPPDEPLFVLRAQDMFADLYVDEWALDRMKNGTPKEMIEEAQALADMMRAWSPRRIPGCLGSIADL